MLHTTEWTQDRVATLIEMRKSGVVIAAIAARLHRRRGWREAAQASREADEGAAGRSSTIVSRR